MKTRKNRIHKPKQFSPNAVAFDTASAAEYIGVSPVSMKMSRTSGLLCGVDAPEFKRAGRKIIYMRKELDKWLDGLPVFKNNAQAQKEIFASS